MKYTEKSWRVEWTYHALELEPRWICAPSDHYVLGSTAMRAARKICSRPGFTARVMYRRPGEPWKHYSTFIHTK